MTTEYPPVRGHIWRHRNGIKYVVLYITNNTGEPRANHPPDVVYATATDQDDGRQCGPMVISSEVPSYNPERIWSRPLSDWHRSFTRESI